MKFLVLTTLLGLALGQKAPPARCCTDHQFEVIMGQVGGTVYNDKGHLTQNWLDGFNVVHYDAFNKLLAVESHQNFANGTTAVTDVLLDYVNKKTYVTNNGACTIMPLTTTMRDPCIPATAKYIGETYMGYGTSKLLLHDWEYHPEHTDQSLKVAVTEEGCTPIVESFIGHVKSPDGKITTETNLVYVFNGFQPGLRKQSVFRIPTNCKTSVQPVGRSIRDIHLMFSK